MNQNNLADNYEDEKIGEISNKKGDKTSKVWNYFNLLNEADKKSYTQCTINGCTEKLAYHNSTSSMLKHLKFNHVTAYESCATNKSKSKQFTLISSNYKIIPLSKEKSQAITIAIGRFIAFDMRPINLIEGTGFEALLKLAEPNYQLPCRTTLMHTIEELYKSTKKDIICQVNNSKSFGITFDYWSSLTTKSYLTLTIHFG